MGVWVEGGWLAGVEERYLHAWHPRWQRWCERARGLMGLGEIGEATENAAVCAVLLLAAVCFRLTQGSAKCTEWEARCRVKGL